MSSGVTDPPMIAEQPMMARAGSGELHCNICEVEAPGSVGVSVLGAAAAIAGDVERANIAATSGNPYRITLSTEWAKADTQTLDWPAL
jgi:hypothetical protein